MLTRKELLGMLGTYWSKYFAADPFIQGLLEGQLALQKQVEQNWEELVLSAYRKHIPVYHLEHAYPFVTRPDLRNASKRALPRFNDVNHTYLDPPDDPTRRSNWLEICDRFGVPSPVGNWYDLPLQMVRHIEKIVDNPIKPTIELLPGRDFILCDDAVSFTVDPSRDGQELEWFLIGVQQDFKWIYKHFGYLLNIEANSSETYRKIIDDIFGAYITGCSAADVFSILATVTGNVVDAKGDSLSEDFKIIHLNQLAQPEEISAVLLPKRYLSNDYFYGITFVNTNLPIFTVNGQSRFYIGGNRSDVERFWSDFERNCRSLTERRNADRLERGEPIIPNEITVNEVLRLAARDSINQINPYKFFCEHIGRYHYTLLHIDYKEYPTEVTLDHVPIRSMLPPWHSLLIQQHLEIEHEISITGPSNDEIFIGLHPLASTAVTTIPSSTLTPTVVSAQIYVGRL